jgi:hypothetical protein
VHINFLHLPVVEEATAAKAFPAKGFRQILETLAGIEFQDIGYYYREI